MREEGRIIWLALWGYDPASAGGLRPVPACAWIPISPDFSTVDDQRRVPASVLRDAAILVPDLTRPSRSNMFH